MRLIIGRYDDDYTQVQGRSSVDQRGKKCSLLQILVHELKLNEQILYLPWIVEAN